MILFLIAVFLRFYRFSEFVMFLGDQGRDAIIVKRILTLEHLPAIGAPTSVGMIYDGPFYYYFIAPWLLFFNNNPVGLAFGVAIFSTIFIVINFFIVKELFNKKIAYISTIFITFSYALIDLSRFSWNPNLLPLFTLLTIYFVIKSIKTNWWIFYALSGAFISFSIQLHFLFLFLIPVIGILYLLPQLKIAKQSISQFRNILISILSFVIFSSPLIIFDLRHQFLNTKNFIKLFTESVGSKGNFFSSFNLTFLNLNKFSFGFDINSVISLLLLVLFIIGFIFLIPKKQTNLKIFYSLFLSFIFFFSFYNGSKHLHYYGLIYPIYFIIIANILSDDALKNFGKYLTPIFIIAFVFLNGINYSFLFIRGGNQVVLSQNVALKISENIKKKKFTVTSLPEKYSDSTYRYFLEIWGKRAIEKDSLEKADELFVVCEKACPLIMGNPQWDIAYFAPNKIVGKWIVEGVKIYKLVR